MKWKNLMKQIKPPCGKCPYRLGTVETTINPCPQCKRNDYDSYERFLNLPMQGKHYKNNGDE